MADALKTRRDHGGFIALACYAEMVGRVADALGMTSYCPTATA